MSYRDRDRGRDEPPLPKPYEFVSLPEGRPRTAPPAGHQRFTGYSGSLTGRLIARSPVHVASGLLEPTRDPKYPMIKAMTRSAGRPVIPGSSLKGCIRSIVEALSGSSVQITRSRELPDKYLPARGLEQLDTAQRIFGALGYQGQANFGDAPLIEGRTTTVPTPQLFSPRTDAVDTYFDGSRPRGRKFYMHGALAPGDLPLEACELGSVFGLTLHFTNLSAGELGLLLTALGMGEPRLWPKLGGGKPACLGTIEVTEALLRAHDPRAAYADFDLPPEPTPLEIAPLLAAARGEGLLLDPQLRQLAETLRWPREDRSCPERNY